MRNLLFALCWGLIGNLNHSVYPASWYQSYTSTIKGTGQASTFESETWGWTNHFRFVRERWRLPSQPSFPFRGEHLTSLAFSTSRVKLLFINLPSPLYSSLGDTEFSWQGIMMLGYCSLFFGLPRPDRTLPLRIVESWSITPMSQTVAVLEFSSIVYLFTTASRSTAPA